MVQIVYEVFIMHLFVCCIFGIIHGVAEFIGIHSDAHVVILKKIFNAGYTVPVAESLKLGALLAAIIFSRHHILRLSCGFRDFFIASKTKDRHFLITVAVSVLPAIVAFGISERYYYWHINAIEGLDVFAFFTILSAVILWYCDRTNEEGATYEISRKHCLMAGLAQLAVMFPGVNGICMSLAVMRYYKYSRVESLKYSLLLYIPITLSIVIYKNVGIIIQEHYWSYVLRILFSFIFSLTTLHVMAHFLKKHSFALIYIYKIFFGLCIAIFYCFILSIRSASFNGLL
jgi:undecaprenyl pyrophosphate phosphatase UppP